MPANFPGEGRSERYEPPALQSSEEQPQELMEQVLEETLAAADLSSPLGADVIRAVRDLVGRYGGQPPDLAAVTELVRCLLASRFPTLAGPREPWLSMTARVAASLWDDPASRQRLQSLWQRLTQGEVDG